mmetsp:Transcript_16537/g.14439  ORF Transcript_16537/g.14439 Transcript_16537/m.14439 type:complete len:93 (+) Transcript_16537:279-557(+)
MINIESFDRLLPVGEAKDLMINYATPKFQERLESEDDILSNMSQINIIQEIENCSTNRTSQKSNEKINSVIKRQQRKWKIFTPGKHYKTKYE